MTVEALADIQALLDDFELTATHIGTAGTFDGVWSEADGQTLDGGVNFDGIIQFMAPTDEILGSVPSFAERDQLTIGGTTYTVDKWDKLADGLSVLYLGP